MQNHASFQTWALTIYHSRARMVSKNSRMPISVQSSSYKHAWAQWQFFTRRTGPGVICDGGFTVNLAQVKYVGTKEIALT